MGQQSVNMLSTKVHIIEKHHLVCSEEPVLAVTAAAAAPPAAAMGAATAATAAVAALSPAALSAAALSAAAMSAAAAAEDGVGGVVRKAAVNGWTICDIVPADIVWPPKGLQGFVSHSSKKFYTIFSLLASASTYHNFCVLQSLLISLCDVLQGSCAHAMSCSLLVICACAVEYLITVCLCYIM